MAVLVGAAVAVWTAGNWFGCEVSLPRGLAATLVAGVAEALAPRGTDNLLVPAAVWAVLSAL